MQRGTFSKKMNTGVTNFGNTSTGQQPLVQRFCIPWTGCITAKHRKGSAELFEGCKL